MVLSLSSEQRSGMTTALLGSVFCFGTTLVPVLSGTNDGLQFPSRTYALAVGTFALCALVAGGVLLLDRVGPSEATT
jgi:hypothetical protein